MFEHLSFLFSNLNITKRIALFSTCVFFITGCSLSGDIQIKYYAPTPDLIGKPSFATQNGRVQISISGERVTHYKYKLGSASAIDCGSWSGYSAQVPISNLISDDVSSYSDGEIRLCVLSYDSNYQIGQDPKNASVYSWYLDRTPTTISINEVEQSAYENDSATKKITFLSSIPKPYPINISYILTGDAVSGLDHDLPLIGAVTIPAYQNSAQLQFHVRQNPSQIQHTYFQLNITGTDSSSAITDLTYQSRFFINDLDSGPRETVSFLHAGNSNACAITQSGKLKCWGANWSGQIGDGSTSEATIPKWVDVSTTYSQVYVNYTTCGITSAGVLKCWGDGSAGQIGDGTTNSSYTPKVVDAGTSYSSVVVEDSTVCAITTAGVLKCWGYNLLGTVGNGTTTNQTSPVIINSGTTFSKVITSQSTTCAITTAGVLKCWGSNSNGQVGDGTTVTKTSPTIINAGTNYSQIFRQEANTCGITSTGVLKCWGDNSYGQLGNGTTVNSSSPVIVDSGVTYSKVAFTGYGGTTCGITTAGVLKCWGSNSNGQVGDGTTTDRLAPTTIDAGSVYSKFIDNYVGELNFCGILTNGQIRCWGYNGWGNLGDGTSSDKYTPTVIDSGISYSSASQQSGSVCGLTTAGIVKCWGDNTNGQLGINTNIVPSPQLIRSDLSFSSLSIGRTGCGITASNSLYCWGLNPGDGSSSKSSPIQIDETLKVNTVSNSQLKSCYINSLSQLICWGNTVGDGTTNNLYIPTMIDKQTVYKNIYAGDWAVCGITNSDALKCWGSNNSGQVGDGTTTDKLSPANIDSGTTYSKVILGIGDHNCGITNSGKLKCWGRNNYGQLGDGTTTNKLVPTLIDSSTNYIDVDVGSTSTCGITSAGVLKCWGDNSGGILGDGTYTNRLNPVIIDGGVTYQSVSSSMFSRCGITTSGIIKCWGANSQGQVGDGTYINRNSPTVVDAGTAYNYIVIKNQNACGVTSTSVLKCWGANGKGQLGTLSVSNSNTPLTILSGTTFKTADIYNWTVCAISSNDKLYCWGDGMNSLTADSSVLNDYFPHSIMKWLVP